MGRPTGSRSAAATRPCTNSGPVVDDLQRRGYQVAVETQGSVWRDWLARVDRLTISPKPPSSGMATAKHAAQIERFMDKAPRDRSSNAPVLKIVCFDDTDLAWAADFVTRYPELPLYLSAGTPVPAPPRLRDAVGERYRWLCERVAANTRARAQPACCRNST